MTLLKQGNETYKSETIGALTFWYRGDVLSDVVAQSEDKGDNTPIVNSDSIVQFEFSKLKQQKELTMDIIMQIEQIMFKLTSYTKIELIEVDENFNVINYK
jgi:hypothetical protein